VCYSMCCIAGIPGGTMETATIREVQHNLAAYVRKVEHGQQIVIRRRNRVVAQLVPAGEAAKSARKVDWSGHWEWLRQTWGDKPLPGKPVSEIVYESRGDR
jgi:prevent-host-death family protein